MEFIKILKDIDYGSNGFDITFLKSLIEIFQFLFLTVVFASSF